MVVVFIIIVIVFVEIAVDFAFDFAEISAAEYGIAMALAFLIIPLVEAYKAVMRAVEKNKA